jgi:hypothetical protein
MTSDLPTLLGRTLAAFGRDCAAADVSPRFSLAMWANLVRPLDGPPRTLGDMRVACCLSRRALNPRLEGLERGGWVETSGAGRAKSIALTATGRAVAEAWRPVPPATEEQWRSTVGAAAIDGLHAALVALAARLPLELPHYPATYGTVDATITGGGGVGGRGADWRPVRRAPDDAAAAADLPLYALLSQALMAFALAYEEEDDGWLTRRGPYFVAAGVLRQVPDESTPTIAPAPGAGLPFWARYMLLRHGLGDAERGPSGRTEVLRLTERGRAWRDGHPGEVARVCRSWRAAYGAGTVDRLAAAMAVVAPHLPPDIPDVPLDA